MSNSQRASITSNPLFIIVAESTVIFCPIFQLGCFSAWAMLTWSSRPERRAQKRPAGSRQDNFVDFAALIALQALKNRTVLAIDGQKTNSLFFAASTNISPAMTNASLLARAISLPASKPVRQGIKPAPPTIAASTTSTSGADATAAAPASPYRISALLLPEQTRRRGTSASCLMATQLGENSFTCLANRVKILSRRHAGYLESIGKLAHQGERAHADGAGRTKQSNCFHG